MRSLAVLGVTAVLQLAVVVVSGSVALLADTVHNAGDALSAVPLGVAFVLARRPATARFPFGLHRSEDLAGLVIVGLILSSALVTGYESIRRLVDPQGVGFLWAVAIAGVVGFAGNEVVAVYRIRTGRRIGSAALVADGHHARVDGFTSLAVVAGAGGVAAGWPAADAVVGLLISVVILGIVWQTSRSVGERLLDGVDPHLTARIRAVTADVEGVRDVTAVRARWQGHVIRAEIDARTGDGATVREAAAVEDRVSRRLSAEVPHFGAAIVRWRTADPGAGAT